MRKLLLPLTLIVVAAMQIGCAAKVDDDGASVTTPSVKVDAD